MYRAILYQSKAGINTFPFIVLRHIRPAKITVGKLHRIVVRPICSLTDLKSTEFLQGRASLGAIRRLSLSLPARSKKRKEESLWAGLKWAASGTWRDCVAPSPNSSFPRSAKWAELGAVHIAIKKAPVVRRERR